MIKKRKNAFTFLEVMVATVAGLVLLLGTATVLACGQAFWNQALRKANLQRDAFYAMLGITRTIMVGNSAVAEDGGEAIRITGQTGWARFYVEPETEHLKFEVQGRTPLTLISSRVQNLRFIVLGSKVEIDLTLVDDAFQVRFVKTVMMRNFGG
jgi:hypothetical protein